MTNFARRTQCFQCNVSKPARAREVAATTAPRTETMRSHNGVYHSDEAEKKKRSGNPLITGGPPPRESEGSGRRRGPSLESTRSVAPSPVLVVRMLPPDIEEGELHVAFAEIDGVQDIRLIRDRVTTLSRGFAFIEFRDIEAATLALKQCEGLIVHQTPVEVSYARDTLSTRSHHATDVLQASRTGASLVVTALEQAQWSLCHGRSGVDVAQTDQTHVAADVNALLDRAAAQVVPQFDEPKKAWPPPFETAGGSYVFVSDYGLYFDQDSMFYYDAPSKLYYNSFTGSYYRCVDPASSGAAAFTIFAPPLPVGEEVYEESTALKVSASSKRALTLSLKKDKKKAGGLALGVKSAAFASASTLQPTPVVGPRAAASSTSTVPSTGTGIKRKSAADIAKWSQRKREATMEKSEEPTPVESSLQEASHQASESMIAALTTVPQEAPICLLCRRKFGSLAMLRKHETLSKLHLTNLAKAQENKQHIAAQYREHEKDMERSANKQRRQDPAPSTQSFERNPTPPVQSTRSALEAGIGGKLLQLMGWQRGQGLGKHGTGITAPIEAASGRDEGAGLGCQPSLSASVDLSDATTDKARRQQLTRARYEAEQV
ncbi:hypothetical protein PsorP6_016247 [Peronosclerospora sorghi]|uniref:Uncharacterized protein n=1 Tax=Peronosclerospora sorghi TaxID=230839 RepID=A0ACC0VQD8_9STRA|nr:hypothetical protein PsorP6_016247 [Peronosclerospora sorghi]